MYMLFDTKRQDWHGNTRVSDEIMSASIIPPSRGAIGLKFLHPLLVCANAE